MSERPCPFNDGTHKLLIWEDQATGRQGQSCKFCHRTWTFICTPLGRGRIGSFVPTWEDRP